MARIQILELPMQHIGEVSTTPFALIVDQVETYDDVANVEGELVLRPSKVLTQDDADRFARTIGAVGAIVASTTLDVR